MASKEWQSLQKCPPSIGRDASWWTFSVCSCHHCRVHTSSCFKNRSCKLQGNAVNVCLSIAHSALLMGLKVKWLGFILRKFANSQQKGGLYILALQVEYSDIIETLIHVRNCGLMKRNFRAIHMIMATIFRILFSVFQSVYHAAIQLTHIYFFCKIKKSRR